MNLLERSLRPLPRLMDNPSDTVNESQQPDRKVRCKVVGGSQTFGKGRKHEIHEITAPFQFKFRIGVFLVCVRRPPGGFATSS